MAHQSQLHTRFATEQVAAILKKYTDKEISTKEAMTYLGIGRTRLYSLVGEYHEKGADFTLAYVRNQPRRLDPAIAGNILSELKFEKEKIIDNPNVPTKRYNYSFIRNELERKYRQSASLPTIINLAKERGYWKPKPPKRSHDRQVITPYAGELIQRDASLHLWAPDSGEKWFLISSIDDYSRAILYADFFLRETTWTHISATESLCLEYGFPFKYYPDQHRIFRYVKDRDKNSPWRTFMKYTDDVDPQWKRVHSTTKEIPMKRFEDAIQNRKTLFRPFEIPKPFQSAKDLFCLRTQRRVDAYRSVSLQGLMPKEVVELRVVSWRETRSD